MSSIGGVPPPSSRPSAGSDVPVSLLLGDPGHGVARYAGQVAEWAGAATATDAARLDAGRRVHLHLTDRVVADSPEAAADVVEALAGRVRLTVTLHDVPQPTDGASFERRVDCYRRVVAAADGWATNSAHEHAQVVRWCAPDHDGAVVPLPVVPFPAGSSRVVLPEEPSDVVGVFGFFYPGKGHAEVLEALEALRASGRAARLGVLGAPAPGHRRDLEDLVDQARRRGVPVDVTGSIPEADLPAALRSVAAAVVGHRNVSASGSLNSWLAAGRRPLVRTGSYAREMADLRPGSVSLFDDDDLTDALARALDDPASTWLPPDADLRPGPAETAEAYVAWWRRLVRSAA